MDRLHRVRAGDALANQQARQFFEGRAAGASSCRRAAGAADRKVPICGEARRQCAGSVGSLWDQPGGGDDRGGALGVGVRLDELEPVGIGHQHADGLAVEKELLVDQIALGVTLDQALHALAARNQVPEYGFFATALALQSETGGTVSDTLERLAEAARSSPQMLAGIDAL